MSLVGELQKLLLSLSNDEWEHGPGIRISTIDNPGWSIDICLNGTPHEELSVEEIDIERSDNDWLYIRVEIRGFEKYLMAACGPENLDEALNRIFVILGRQ